MGDDLSVTFAVDEEAGEIDDSGNNTVNDAAAAADADAAATAAHANSKRPSIAEIS